VLAKPGTKVAFAGRDFPGRKVYSWLAKARILKPTPWISGFFARRALKQAAGNLWTTIALAGGI
jgi:hypothetical protein